MKKTILILAILLVGIFLLGCTQEALKTYQYSALNIDQNDLSKVGNPNLIVNCDGNMDCFILHAKDCSFAQLDVQKYNLGKGILMISPPGAPSLSNLRYEIRGYRGKDCIFYRGMFYNDECEYPPNEIPKMLERWEVGTSSTNDWNYCKNGAFIPLN